MKTETKSIPVSFADWEGPGRIPRWARGFNAMRASVRDLVKAKELPGVIVLESRSGDRFFRHTAGARQLSKRLEHAQGPFKLLLSLSGEKRADADLLTEILHVFPETVSRHVEFAVGRHTVEQSLVEALAKYRMLEEERGDDPLAEAREVIEVTRPLLAESGRLSARRVATAFGLPLAQLARLIGCNKQTVAKTPDSPRIQNRLRPFERMARLRSVFSDEQFRAWLQRPNRHLDDRTPHELIEAGRAEVVAELVEDMLLGTPA